MQVSYSSKVSSRPIKLPQQVRSQARVGRLLDAAAVLITQRGVEALTMAAVGQAAATAPGSLYQFFPNRDELVNALIQREAARVEACVAKALAAWTQGQRRDPATIVDALLAPLRELYRAHPVWGELLHALARRGEPGEVEQALDEAVLAQLSKALILLAPDMSPGAVTLAARVVLDLGHSGLLAAGNDELMYFEVRRCLAAYLEAWRQAGV